MFTAQIFTKNLVEMSQIIFLQNTRLYKKCNSYFQILQKFIPSTQSPPYCMYQLSASITDSLVQCIADEACVSDILVELKFANLI